LRQIKQRGAQNPAVSFAVLAHPVPSHSFEQKLRRLARSHFEDRSRRRGLLVAFEGPDGSGKTTQRKLFKTWLKSDGYNVVTTKWNSSELIRPIIKSRKAIRVLSPLEFSLLHAADFRHRVENVVLPALWDGKLVIADRFLFTGLARDVARGLDFDQVLKLYQPLLWPDLVFYFSVSARTSSDRVTRTGKSKAKTSRLGQEALQPRRKKLATANRRVTVSKRRSATSTLASTASSAA